MEDKEKIKKTLKDFGRLPTSRIGAIIGMHLDKAKRLLNELLEEKKVIKIKETNSIYWEITNKGRKEIKEEEKI